jgi:hypothetical protein
MLAVSTVAAAGALTTPEAVAGNSGSGLSTRHVRSAASQVIDTTNTTFSARIADFMFNTNDNPFSQRDISQPLAIV